MRIGMKGLAGLLIMVAASTAHAQWGTDRYNSNNGYGSNSDVVRCESTDGRTRQCNMGTRYGVRLVRQLSRSQCVQGHNWDVGRYGVWVSGGCRAEFVAGYGNDHGRGNYGQNPYGSGYNDTFLCESPRNDYNECPVPGRGRAVLVQQVSKNACIEGRSWGSERGVVWVNNGCRGHFRVQNAYGYGNNGYGNGYGNNPYGNPNNNPYGNAYNGTRSFLCESKDGRQNFCPVDTRSGVRFRRQVSQSACIEGRTWGIDRAGVWVAGGCRAEFEVRDY